jgi:hypothetical protein
MKTAAHKNNRSRLAKLLRVGLAAAIVLLCPALFMSCGSGYSDSYHCWSHSVFVHNGDVYAAGVINSVYPGPGYIQAVLWKNGQIFFGTDPKSRDDYHASSVFVDGTDVYVAGYHGNTTDVRENGGVHRIIQIRALLWKNGEPQYLTDGSQQVFANSVFVSEGDVYVAGNVFPESNNDYRAVLWKNGEAQYLSESGHHSYASSIFVSGGDVYVVGTEVNGEEGGAVLWKNGNRQYLGSAQNCSATSLFVSGDDVYVVGNRGWYEAILWKNGEPQPLSDGSQFAVARSVFVSNGDVYVSGYNGLENPPVVWKNGEAQLLGGGNGEANSIFVSNGDVYVTGEIEDDAVIWKNGAVQKLPRK